MGAISGELNRALYKIYAKALVKWVVARKVAVAAQLFDAVAALRIDGLLVLAHREVVRYVAVRVFEPVLLGRVDTRGR